LESLIVSRRFVLAVAFCAFVAGTFTGCNTQPPAPAAPAATTPTATSSARCDDILNNVLQQLEPRSVGITSDAKVALQQLNDWANRCGQAQETPPSVPAAFSALLSEAARGDLTATRYTAPDGEILREATLFKSVAGYVAGNGANDRERVTRIFAHVIRTVSLEPPGTSELPLTTFDRYLLGNGSPSDRAAVFVSLLRQFRYDSVVFTTPDSATKTDAPVLVGVLYDGGLRLYDMTTGRPLLADPAQVDGPVVAWTELLAKPESIGQLSAPKWKHPLGPDGVPTLQPGLAGPAGVWSMRMLRLQGAMAGELAVVAAEGLADGPAGPGLLSRVGGVLGVAREKLVPWERLSRLAVARDGMTDMQRDMFQRAMLAWGAPVPFEADDKGQPVAGRPSRTFLKLRLALATGAFEEAISEFPREVVLPCRAIMNAPIPEIYRYQAIDAANEGTYWMAVAQFEKGDAKIAGDSAARYLRNSRQALAQVVGEMMKFSSRKKETFEGDLAKTFDTPAKKGFVEAIIAATRDAAANDPPEQVLQAIRGVSSTFRRIGPSQLLLAKSRHAAGDPAGARLALEAIAADSPQYPEARLLLAQWSTPAP
jgi:hypothetical protein